MEHMWHDLFLLIVGFLIGGILVFAYVLSKWNKHWK